MQRDFETAKQIFLNSTRPEAVEKLASLYQNVGIFFWRLGRFEEAREAYDYVLMLLQEGKVNRPGLEAMMHLQIGHIYGHQGMSRESTAYFEKALTLCLDNPMLREGVFMAHQNLAISELNRGLYQQCFDRLETYITQEQGASPRTWLGTQRLMIECFLALNDFAGAVEVAERLVNDAQQAADIEQRGPALMFLGTAQAELGLFAQAREQFSKALAMFEAGGFPPQIALAHLRLAQVAFNQQDYDQARKEAQTTLPYWISTRHQLQEADTRLLLANIAFFKNDPSESIVQECETALQIANTCESFQHRYAANVLLGHVAQRGGDVGGAERFYTAALGTIDEVQRDLAMTFRPGFLSDKGEALRALVRLYLATSRPQQAFEAVERYRAHVMDRYLVERHLPISHQGISDPLHERLATLREDFVAYTNRATLTWAFDEDIEDVQEQVRVAARQKAGEIGNEIRNITRKLKSLSSSVPGSTPSPELSISELQAGLTSEETLIAYYDDGECITAFCITSHSILPTVLGRTRDIKSLIHALDTQVNFGLSAVRLLSREQSMQRGYGLLELPAFRQPTLNRSFERASAKLYDALIKPLEGNIWQDNDKTKRQLIIVPYGILHFVPFHLLYDSRHRQFLTGSETVTVLPAASLLRRKPVNHPSEVVIIYDDLDGKLHHPAHDARCISELFQGAQLNVNVYSAKEALANGILEQSSGQILHIIAHAHFDALHPELSFIQLDGQPFTMTDIMRSRLNYQLVVLTACETGRLNLVEREGRGLLGDDLAGLGRTFLYAGARAVVASRWVIGDGMTLPLFEHFYERLQNGSTLADALKGAQTDLTNPSTGVSDLHPAFWGTFQFIGENRGRIPFSKHSPMSVTQQG